MKLGVISDTHVKRLDEIPAVILKALAEVDLIIHCGDFTDVAVLEGLKKLGEVKAVCGNMDSGELKKILPQKELFVVKGKRIGLTHGSGGPWGIADRVRQMFDEMDLIIYGHSHETCNRYLQGSLFIQPGSGQGLLWSVDD